MKLTYIQIIPFWIAGRDSFDLFFVETKTNINEDMIYPAAQLEAWEVGQLLGGN